MSSIVRNPTTVAAVTAGQTRDIWNITEHSESSKSSEESLKQNDKMLMIRPATPYRNKIVNSERNNPAFVDHVSLGSSDDVFTPEGLPHHKYSFDDCDIHLDLREKLRRSSTSTRRKWSMSSPQLSRSVFVVEDENRLKDKPLGIALDDLKCNSKSKIGGFNVSKIFKNRRSLNRSFSDEGGVSTENIHTAERNGVVRGSCGS